MEPCGFGFQSGLSPLVSCTAAFTITRNWRPLPISCNGKPGAPASAKGEAEAGRQLRVWDGGTGCGSGSGPEPQLGFKLGFDLGVELGVFILPVAHAHQQRIVFFITTEAFAPREVIAGDDNEQLLVAQLGICIELEKSPEISLVRTLAARLFSDQTGFEFWNFFIVILLGCFIEHCRNIV